MEIYATRGHCLKYHDGRVLRAIHGYEGGLPLRSLVEVVAKGCGLSDNCLTTFRTTVWEDNMGALTLANLDPGQNTSRSKFYDSKVHWFRSHLKPNSIEVKKVDTKEQRADLFTKPLLRDAFVNLRKLLIGW